MLTLGELAALLLALGACAWLWHAHGVHEHALRLVREACRREDVLLLDDNVAFRRLRLRRDRNGRRRLAREYGFEFTVTGEQRHSGRIVLFGRVPALIELAPHPFREPAAGIGAVAGGEPAPASPVPQPATAATPDRQTVAAGAAPHPRVVSLDEWRRRRPPQER